ADLAAGAQTAQVMQPLALGAPPIPHSGTGSVSGIAAFVISPAIAPSSPARKVRWFWVPAERRPPRPSPFNDTPEENGHAGFASPRQQPGRSGRPYRRAQDVSGAPRQNAARGFAATNRTGTGPRRRLGFAAPTGAGIRP